MSMRHLKRDFPFQLNLLAGDHLGSIPKFSEKLRDKITTTDGIFFSPVHFPADFPVLPCLLSIFPLSQQLLQDLGLA